MPQAAGVAASFLISTVTASLASSAATTTGAVFIKAFGFAVEAGVTYAIAQLLKRHDDDDDDRRDTSSPGEVDEVSQQTVPYQRILFGEFTVTPDAACVLETSLEGSEVPFELINDPDRASELYTGDPGSYLVDMFLIANHECAELVNVTYIGAYSRDIIVNTDSDGYVRENATHKLYYGGRPFLAISTRLGKDDQELDPIIQRNFPDAGPDELYGENFRQLGHTTFCTEKYYGVDSNEHREVWGNATDLRPRFKGAKVFDPRDPEQTWSDPSTFKHTRNPVLIGHWLLQNKDFMGEETVTYEDFDFEMMRFHADICDRGLFTLSGEVIPQYTCDGYIHLGERPYDIFVDVLAACNGKLLYRNGSLQIEPGYPKQSVGVITDRDILGDFEYERFTPASETLTRVIPRGIIPEANYQYESAPFVEYDDGQLIKNERSVNFRFLEGSTRLQRNARVQLLEANQERGLTCLGGPVFEEYDAGDVITLDTQDFGFANGDYELLSLIPGELKDTWEVIMIEYDPLKYEWNPDTDESPLDLLTFRRL